MKIKLDDEFTLNSDRYCVWVSQTRTTKKGRKKGEEYDDNVSGYHRNIVDCFESYFETSIRTSEATSITKLIDTIKKERNRIKGWCEAIDKHIAEVRTDREDKLV